MTLIELLATLAILGILTAIAVPSFRSFQGRQSLLLAQRNVQSALYRMQQLALAPPDTTQTTYEVVGFGLGFNRAVTSLEGCALMASQTNTDFLALYQFTRNKNTGVISKNLYRVTNPGQSGCNGTILNITATPDTFTALPKDVAFSTNNPLPALLVTPLQAIGQRYGNLCDANGSANICSPYTELLTSPTSATLYVMHRKIKNPSSTSASEKLCRSVGFSRNTTITIDAKIVPGGCS